MSKYLQVVSFDLETRVKDALQNRRISDKTKINELANIAKGLADAWKDDDRRMTSHMTNDAYSSAYLTNYENTRSSAYSATNYENTRSSGNELLVYKAIQSFVSEIGISRTELETKFSDIPRQELFDIIMFLEVEGVCYSTIDADHFKVSDE